MGKRLPYTPNSQIRSALRKLFLRSRERAARIKADRYTCQKCGKKQSKARGREIAVEVHHRDGIENWPELINAVRRYLLCNPKEMETLCVDCHKTAEMEQLANQISEWVDGAEPGKGEV